MKLKELIKKKGFWAAVAGAVVLVLQLFGVRAPLPYVNEIIGGVCAVLVAAGLLSASEKEQIDEELKNRENKEKTDDDSEDKEK